MFIDQVKLTLTAGKGGDGIIAWRREKYIPKGGPSGGSGGKGGSIILKADPQVFSLESFRNSSIIKADNGAPGGSNNKTGRTGKDLIISVPVGTLVKDPSTQEVFFDFVSSDQTFTLCLGGVGGRGNYQFRTPTNQAPTKHTPGRFGETKKIELELKLLADVGLIGMPNAGKSTLIEAITDIPVKIAPYPFTTLKPNLGLIEFEDYSRILLADIPGIIEKAHLNKGLGLSFLRHIERTEVLLFVIDISPQEGRDPKEDFLTLQNEIASYDPALLQKPFLVALNKIDEMGAKERGEDFEKNISLPPKTLFTISALTGEGIDSLLLAIKEKSQKNGKKFL
ncbi:MAG: GTPase ObgE [Chlamydiota bacterium]